jgi:polysaccharide pyruvyl transferase WcaK-like protein
VTAGETKAYRVGFWGVLGDGNIGNDAQLESMLAYIRGTYPNAVVDAMCAGPEIVRRAYGIGAVPMHWQQQFETGAATGRARQGSGAAGRRLPSPRAIAINAVAKVADAVATMAWVRRHDVVIVPGMGVLEAALPLRPWETPYSMFLLCAAGRLFRTKVALVSVGASPIRQRSVRWLFDAAARLASYRSYRDVLSLWAMRERGVDVSGDRVYPDLAFGIPVPLYPPSDEKTVAIGVMAFYGGNDDRKVAAELHAAYAARLKRFVRWLVDGGYSVRLFIGDPHDKAMVQEVLDDVRAYLPDLDADRVAPARVVTFEDQLSEMAVASTIVASRYHNVVGGLLLARPTISIGYSKKHATLMAEMGLADFCQDAHSLDVDLLIKQFTMARERAEELRPQVEERCAAKAIKLDEQFTLLSELLFPAGNRAAGDR